MAAVITSGIYLVDAKRLGLTQASDASQLARQLSAQAETLALEAREKGETQPIAWSVRLLSQGPAPQLAKLATLRTDPGKIIENNFQETDSTYKFTKLFSPEKGEGIKIEISKKYNGFLGTRSIWASDLAILLVLLAIYSIAYFATHRNSETPKIREQIKNWCKKFRSNFIDLSMHLREIIRAAQKIATAASESKTQISNLNEKLRTQINDAHLGVRSALEAEKAAREVQEILKDVASKLPSELRGQIETALMSARRAHVTAQSARVLFEQVEKDIEPLAMDSDLALSQFDELFSSTQALSAEIKEATTGMKNLSSEIGNLSA